MRFPPTVLIFVRVVTTASLAALAFGAASFLCLTAMAETPQKPAQYRVAASNPCAWANYDWEDMPEDVQRNWEVLGWTQQSWDSDDPAQQPRSELKDWSQLSRSERNAARRFGYNESTWGSDKCR